MLFTREFYISGRNATLAHSDPAYGIEIYYYQSRNNKPCTLFFAGKAQKPWGDYYYTSEESREEAASKWLGSQIKLREERKQAKAEKLSYQYTLQVGDLLHSQWGWEQTNNDYYQVIAIKGKSVVLREIAQAKTYQHSMSGITRPVKHHFIGEPFTKRVLTSNCVKITSYAYASLCDENKTTYFSEYA